VRTHYYACAALGVAAVLSLAGCTDERLIGTRAERASATCDSQCDAGERCHPELEQCVECVEDADCERSPSGSRCDQETYACRACNDGEACPQSSCDDDDDDLDERDDDDCDVDDRDGAIDDDELPDV
jgi:hypothetical protein